MESTGRVIAMQRKLTQKDMERTQIPRRFWESRFNGIPGEGDCSDLQSKIARYLQDLDANLDAGIGLFLHGPNGPGKTSAMVVILKSVQRRLGRTALFLHSAQLKNIVFGRVMFTEDQSLWDRAMEVDFLLVDDLGKGVEDSKGAWQRVFDDLVRQRAANQKATGLTANVGPKELRGQNMVKTSTLAAMEECIVPIKVRAPNQRAGAMQELRKQFA